MIFLYIFIISIVLAPAIVLGFMWTLTIITLVGIVAVTTKNQALEWISAGLVGGLISAQILLDAVYLVTHTNSFTYLESTFRIGWVIMFLIASAGATILCAYRALETSVESGYPVAIIAISCLLSFAGAANFLNPFIMYVSGDQTSTVIEHLCWFGVGVVQILIALLLLNRQDFGRKLYFAGIPVFLLIMGSIDQAI